MITIVLFTILLIYSVSIGLLTYGFTKVNTIEYTGLKPKTAFTIIVPFRDEAKNLPILLESLSKLNYPTELVEVILVDDESEEAFTIPLSSRAQSRCNIQIIKNNRISNSPKKDAITTAMQTVHTDWIITTDADCTFHANWLLTLDNYIQLHHVSMIAGAVTYACKNSFLHHFQQLDLASLQGATIGSFGINKGFMCNGANFAYTKSFFQELKGFEGNDGIASGDDVFLLQKAVNRFPEKVHYLKSQSNIVITKPLNNWKSLFYQRIRWASKTSSYQSAFGKGLGILVFMGNLGLVLGIGFLVSDLISFRNLFLLFVIKFSIDSLLIYKTNHFLTQNKMRYLILSSVFYPFFSSCVALYSLFGKYEWKGRRF